MKKLICIRDEEDCYVLQVAVRFASTGYSFTKF